MQTQNWSINNFQVNCVAWAPNSVYVASGGLDTSIILWSVEAPDKHCIIRLQSWQIMQMTVMFKHNNSLTHMLSIGMTERTNSGMRMTRAKSPMLHGSTTPAWFPLGR